MFKKMSIFLSLAVMSVPLTFGLSLLKPSVSMAQSELCLTVNDLADWQSLYSASISADTSSQTVLVVNSSGQQKTFSYNVSADGTGFCFAGSDLFLFLAG